MIPSLSEMALAVYGAWRLARFDARGLGYFDRSVDGLWRSFFAAVIVAPAYALMLVVRFSWTAEAANPVRFAAAEIVAYITAWVAYPVVMYSVAQALGRLDRYPAYICAYNWSLVLQNALVLPLSILSVTGVLQPGLGNLLWLGAIGAVLVYVWFIARTALELSGVAAVGIVAIDIFLSILISGVAEGLY